MVALKIFDKKLSKYVDIFYLVLMASAKDSIIPEIYEIFGRESMIKFMDLFSGTTIKVPNRKIIKLAIIKATIYAELNEEFSNEKVAELAIRFDISQYKVRKYYKRVTNLVAKL